MILKEHRVDSYFGALFITLFGAGAAFLILHTVNTMPIEAFTAHALELPVEIPLELPTELPTIALPF